MLLITLHVPLTIDSQTRVSWQAPPAPQNQRVYCVPPRLGSQLWAQGMSQNSATHFKCFWLFIYYCLSRGVLRKLAHILSVPFFFHSPFFCMPFLLFLPFLQSSVPVCRHHGDDRTSSSRLVPHYCLSTFSALLRGQGKPEEKKCSLQGSSHSK